MGVQIQLKFVITETFQPGD